MTDDIVARLRQECGCQWIPWNEVPCKPCRAADEIERLRARLGKAENEIEWWSRVAIEQQRLKWQFIEERNL